MLDMIKNHNLNENRTFYMDINYFTIFASLKNYLRFHFYQRNHPPCFEKDFYNKKICFQIIHNIQYKIHQILKFSIIIKNVVQLSKTVKLNQKFKLMGRNLLQTILYIGDVW
jgi:hypothetical protein